MEITHIQPTPIAKVAALLNAILGLFAGVLISIGTLLGSAAAEADVGVEATGFGVASIIVLPLLYALFGFVSGFVFAFVYNGVAKKIGGVVIETREYVAPVKEVKPTESPSKQL